MSDLCPPPPPPPRLGSPSSSLPQQSGKSWAVGALGSGPGRPRPRSLEARGQAGASCLSSRAVRLARAVLYRKLATDEEVAAGGRSWGGPLGAWPCRPQSRDPLAIREMPFNSTRAFESLPPSSSGLGEGKDTRQLHPPVPPGVCLPRALPLQNTTAREVCMTSPHFTGRGAGPGGGVTCPGPHGWAIQGPGPCPLASVPPLHQSHPFSCS